MSRRDLVSHLHGIASENDIYRWERGQHQPGRAKIEALATVLECDPEYLLHGNGNGDAVPQRPATYDLALARIEVKLDAIIEAMGVALDEEIVTEAAEALRTHREAPAAAGKGGRSRSQRATRR